MKKGWEIKKLGELVNIKTGKLDSNAMVDGGKYPFFTCSREIFAINDYAFDCEAILLAGNNASGDFNVKHYKGKFNAYQRTYVITVNAENKILYSYLYQQLTNHLKRFKEQSLGANTKFLKIGMIQGMEIPLPPLPEQQRIVAILDEAFAAIAKAKANAEQNLKNAKELFESYLQGVFENKGEGWEEKTLKELTTHLGDGLHGTPKYTFEGDYYFINGNNLTDGAIEFKESTKRVSIDEYNKHKKNLTDRTVLVSINGTLGNVAFYNGEKIILGKSACYFNLKESVDKNFILYVLSSPYFLNYAQKEATGATIKNVSLKTMREFLVPIPSIKEQQTIVQKLDALSTETKKLEAIYNQKINDLDELKKSVLQKAFSGELKTAKVLV